MYLLVIVSLALSLIGVFAIFYIFNRHLEVARVGVKVEAGHNAVVEPFLVLLEHRVAAIGRALVGRFYSLAFTVLSRLLPQFRRLTRSTEAWLVRTVQMVRGKREHNYLGRKAASQHLQDMGNHQDQVRKEGGSIE